MLSLPPQPDVAIEQGLQVAQSSAWSVELSTYSSSLFSVAPGSTASQSGKEDSGGARVVAWFLSSCLLVAAEQPGPGGVEPVESLALGGSAPSPQGGTVVEPWPAFCALISHPVAHTATAAFTWVLWLQLQNRDENSLPLKL